jgi:hypothetical protein
MDILSIDIHTYIHIVDGHIVDVLLVDVLLVDGLLVDVLLVDGLLVDGLLVDGHINMSNGRQDIHAYVSTLLLATSSTTWMLTKEQCTLQSVKFVLRCCM